MFSSDLFLPVLKVFELFSVKTLCTEMCVTVYYLNVSGLQSDRHANKKDNMFLDCLFLSLSYMCQVFLYCFFNVLKRNSSTSQLQVFAIKKWSHYQNENDYLKLGDILLLGIPFTILGLNYQKN